MCRNGPKENNGNSTTIANIVERANKEDKALDLIGL